jgi:hypothetical protein
VYLGDSASLTYLGTIRRLVESILGSSNFTDDLSRYKIVEGSIVVEKKPTLALPDYEAAAFLVNSFFLNVGHSPFCLLPRLY